MNINFGTNNINLDIAENANNVFTENNNLNLTIETNNVEASNETKVINAEVGVTKVVRYEKNHANLDDLDYENSGHTGFQPAGNYIEEEQDPTVPRYIKNITENDIQKWNNKAEVDDIPDTNNFAKKTDIPDVSNFITKDVSNLTNYYNKDYIDNMLGNIESLLSEV